MPKNARRGLEQREYELVDTGVFDGGRYFDVQIEYAKAGVDEIVMLRTVTNRGPGRCKIYAFYGETSGSSFRPGRGA